MWPIETSSEPATELLTALAEGEASLADVLQLSPAVLEQVVDKAMGLARYGKLDEAAALLEDLAVVDRRSAMLPFLLGTVQATQADHASAMLSYGEALLRDERSRTPEKRFAAEVRLLRARSALAVGEGAIARSDLEEVASADVEGVSATAKSLLAAWQEADDADPT